MLCKFVNKKDAVALLNSYLAIRHLNFDNIGIPTLNKIYLSALIRKLVYQSRLMYKADLILNTKVVKGVVKVQFKNSQWVIIEYQMDIKKYVPELKKYVPELKKYVPELKKYVPELKKYVPELKKYVPELKKYVPELKKYVPELKKYVPELKKYVPELKKYVPEYVIKDD